MFRIVIDTSVLAAALRSRAGASNAVLRLVAERRVLPLVTTALFLEYEEVLKRPEQRIAHGFELDELDSFLGALASACEPVEIRFHWRPQLSDPGDEMVLEAAANGHADALVTFNVRHFAAALPTFGIKTVEPGEFLAEIAR